jgi:hypothetical protein
MSEEDDGAAAFGSEAPSALGFDGLNRPADVDAFAFTFGAPERRFARP